MYDVVVIGAGAIGCAIARELSRYDLKLCVLEKASDVCEGTSKANSAIVHGGFDAATGTLKAKLNVEGNRLMGEYAEKLDFPFRRNGSMVVCFDESGVPVLHKLAERGRANGVEGIEVLSREEALKLEPNLADDVYAVMRVPSAGIVCPFLMTIALAENAAANGCEFRLETEVTGIERLPEGGYRVITPKGTLETVMVVNAAGVYADAIHNMVSGNKLHITPRKGEYILLDKSAASLVDHTVFQVPTKMGKGVLVTPTIHGNLLIGPTAVDIDDKENTQTTREGLLDVQERSAMSIKNIPYRSAITSFCGLRAHEEGDDFIIGEVSDAKNFIDAAGIESPGLSSAPAIGRYVAGIVKDLLSPAEKKDFIGTRKGITNFMSLSPEEKESLIRKDPAYGQIVCRCEMITEGEIVEAIRRPLGARTLDGVKRRVRAGMGRCQAGFCTPKTMEILERELGLSAGEIRKNMPGSELVVGINKDRL